jgi:threonine/homoserine/homoserine lactone efflux protein
MLGIQNYEAFVLSCVALNLIPGSDNFYILGRSIAQGRKVGIASALGISMGALIHSVASAVGLSALITASTTAFFAVKLAGACYLIYLGAKFLLQKSEAMNLHSEDHQSKFGAAFRQGLITNVLNPKVAMFFLAFLPQFISVNDSSPTLSFLVLGLTFVCTSTVWTFILAYFSSAMSSAMRGNPQFMRYLNYGTGALLVGLGFKLAAE